MATVVWVVLALLSLGVLVLAGGLYTTVGAAQLNTPQAFVHDGPRVGRPLPRVTGRSLDGRVLDLPRGPQVLLFADHSLVDFPDLVALLRDPPDDLPPITVLARSERSSADLMAGLGLGVAVALVPSRAYTRCRVRVMPYAVVVDAAGRAVASGLVNTGYQLRRTAHHLTVAPR